MPIIRPNKGYLRKYSPLTPLPLTPLRLPMSLGGSSLQGFKWLGLLGFTALGLYWFLHSSVLGFIELLKPINRAFGFGAYRV